MAHPFIVAPLLSPLVRTTQPTRRESAPLSPPPQSHADLEGLDFGPPSSDRSNSNSPTSPDMDPAARGNSALAAHRNPSIFNSSTVRTRSLGFGAGVVFEREAREPTDDDVIIVTVKLRNKFRKQSVDGADDLPSRPQPRSFLRRLSTRVASSFDHSAEKEERYKAVKMPRRDYKRYFRRDANGAYVGTEPEREWDEDEVMKEFEAYQDLPLHTILC